MIEELVRATRSYRRFVQAESVSRRTLLELVDLARLAGTARNVQPLKYLLVNDPKNNAGIFSHLGWAGYLQDWPGPAEGERPAAYIICLLDTTLSNKADCDLGIASQNILLGATARGLGGCRIGSFAPQLADLLHLPVHLEILLVLALGKPKERVVVDQVVGKQDIRYWRDSDQVHHVPKRTLADIIVEPEAKKS